MKLRVARHTADLQPILAFYRDLLGMELLGCFNDHSEYDGIFLGIPDAPWHLEFTVSNDPPVHTPDEDDLLVFYVGEKEFSVLTEKLRSARIPEVIPKNPYWKDNGITFSDPDGFRIVLTILRSNT
jgi:catechol 2,3-dioxygenase-like lactoylglutathione lyase family enzyme